MESPFQPDPAMARPPASTPPPPGPSAAPAPDPSSGPSHGAPTEAGSTGSGSQPTGGSDGAALPADAGGPHGPRWRRRLLFGCLPVIALAIVVVAALIVVVNYNRSNQSIVSPPGTGPVPTSPPVTSPATGAASTVLSIVQQPWGVRAIGWSAPADLGADEKVPLVVLLHGLGETPELVLAHGDWVANAVRHRFIVETPMGVQNSWNAGECCLPAKALGVDDVAFLDAVIADALKRPNVDPGRIYMVGQSNGGMMAFQYACQRGDRLAGLGLISATSVSACQPKVPMPVFHAHGTADQVVPYGGGATLASAILGGGISFPSAEQSSSDTAAAMGCSATPTTETAGIVTTRVWASCREPGRVELFTVEGGQHGWLAAPGRPTTDAALRALSIVRG